MLTQEIDLLQIYNNQKVTMQSFALSWYFCDILEDTADTDNSQLETDSNASKGNKTFRTAYMS